MPAEPLQQQQQQQLVPVDTVASGSVFPSPSPFRHRHQTESARRTGVETQPLALIDGHRSKMVCKFEKNTIAIGPTGRAA